MTKKEEPISSDSETSESLIPAGEVKDERQLTHVEHIFKFRMQRLNQIKSETNIAKNQIELARQKVRKDIMPIIDRIALQKFEFIKILDNAYEKHFFASKYKGQIRALIEEKSYHENVI